MCGATEEGGSVEVQDDVGGVVEEDGAGVEIGSME